MDTDMSLVQKAREAQETAYAPYSHFQVGAALLTKDGRIYSGANIENSSYGLTVCAERVAVFKAVHDGVRDFQSIAITASGAGYPYPCGACLQVLAEFAPDIHILVADGKNQIRKYTLKDLLPLNFSLQ